MLAFLLFAIASSLSSGAIDDEADEAGIIWGKPHKGLIAGAKLLSATGELNPGDPVVVQFVLKNDTDKETTIVLQRTSEAHPVLGEANRLELNVLGNSSEKTQHTLKPGKILEDAKYRVTVSTAGMQPGDYHITSGSAFWMVKEGEANRATGIPFRKSIPFKLGDGDSKTLRQPPKDDQQKIHWGKPTGNLVLGMRLLDDRKTWPGDGVDIEGQLFLFNAGDEPTELTYELPNTPADWNMHLTGDGNKFVRLDSTWFTGVEPTKDRTIKIDAGQSLPLTGIEGEVSTGGKDPVKEAIKGPLLRILKDKTEFKYGDPKRLIDQHGQFEFHAAITIRMKELTDSVIVASTAPVPFKVADENAKSTKPDSDKK